MDYSGRIHRLIRMLMLIQTDRQWTPQRLAEEFGTAERTIYRDLQHLRNAGFPIIFDRESNQYRVNGKFFMPPIHLTFEEALSLATLCEHVAGSERIPLLKPAYEALHKIESQLPAAIQNDLSQTVQHVAIQTASSTPADSYGNLYDVMRNAIATRRRVMCKYEAQHSDKDDESSGDAAFEFEPYALFFSVRAWYVIGQRSDRDGLRCLKLTRFTQASATDRPYMVPDDFSVDEYLGNAWRMIRGEDVPVEIWFDAEFAPTVSETRWHKTQEIEHHADGSCTFRFTVSGLDEIEWWVLSMGPHCIVRQPVELARRVRDLAMRTAELYRSHAESGARRLGD